MGIKDNQEDYKSFLKQLLFFNLSIQEFNILYKKYIKLSEKDKYELKEELKKFYSQEK